MDEPLRCYRHPDRETYVSCADCGRGICPDCMTFGPVGIRCPDHASASAAASAPRRLSQRALLTLSEQGPIVTQALIAINVLVFLAELALGGNLNGTGSWIYEKGVLVSSAVDPSGQLVGVAHGEWWRLLTAAFLHYGPLHLGMNMLVLWFLGPGVEDYFGHVRFALLYLVAGLAGSAGALLWSPSALTVGASGAIWGLMGAALVLERRRIYVFGGQAMALLLLNVLITLFLPGISIGGHFGGLVGGVLSALAFTSLRRSPLLATGSVAAVGLAAVALALVGAGSS
ncbi:MAG: rhomboid family intramembrane serine protease [Thermoleophilia bacterium]|nr:rhomboid family intramembrane serine protease [Gaiellaceae bacterium]MDW8339430.1 rhomboid family intramembrane serine protease [Thermoleophilia bacterium]